MSRKLILKNTQSPGDILMLTAALRDLHLCYPGKFQTDVRTSCPDLWLHNPYLTSLDENDPDVEIIDCHYPLIHQSNQRPNHFVTGFTNYLNDELNLSIHTTAIRGDIHLSHTEREQTSIIETLAGRDIPYWIIVAGGKYDFTIKWWHYRRYQQVVDALCNEVLFVQVGESGHFHPQLSGTVDLIGKTALRELIVLMAHAQGVLCPVTFLMHLAAAVPNIDESPSHRAGVIVAGGREPPHWEAYPWHQFIHNVGALPCCREGGCWRSRTVPIADADDDRNDPSQLCVDVRDGLPHCMDMIRPDEVVSKIRTYFQGGALHPLTEAAFQASRAHVVPSLRSQYQ